MIPYLRPYLTEQLWEKLLNERAVNLYGPPYSGRKRLLTDVQAFAETHSYQSFLIDMKDHVPFDYQSFLMNLYKQMGIWHNGYVQESLSFQLLVYNALAVQNKTFFLFHHFDALLNNEQHHFPMAFFNDLNSLKNTSSDFRCCCVTEQPHDHSCFKAKDDIESKMSWLQLQPIDMALHPLTLEEIRQELEHIGYLTPKPERMADYIHRDSKPMQLFVALQNTMHLKSNFTERIDTIEAFRQRLYQKK